MRARREDAQGKLPSDPDRRAVLLANSLEATAREVRRLADVDGGDVQAVASLLFSRRGGDNGPTVAQLIPSASICMALRLFGRKNAMREAIKLVQMRADIRDLPLSEIVLTLKALPQSCGLLDPAELVAFVNFAVAAAQLTGEMAQHQPFFGRLVTSILLELAAEATCVQQDIERLDLARLVRVGRAQVVVLRASKRGGAEVIGQAVRGGSQEPAGGARGISIGDVVGLTPYPPPSGAAGSSTGAAAGEMLEGEVGCMQPFVIRMETKEAAARVLQVPVGST